MGPCQIEFNMLSLTGGTACQNFLLKVMGQALFSPWPSNNAASNETAALTDCFFFFFKHLLETSFSQTIQGEGGLLAKMFQARGQERADGEKGCLSKRPSFCQLPCWMALE